MMSDDEPGTPPGTLRRHKRKTKKTKNRRRSPSSSSSSDEAVPRKIRKRANKLSTKDILKLVKHVSKDPSKNSWNNNNFNNVIPEFDPSNRTQTIECWLRKVNECAVIYGWDKKQTVHFSLQKLVGLAKKWFEALSTVVFTWDEWQVKLKKAFPSEENYGRLLEEMLNRTSRSDESLREYFYDKIGLLNRCEIIGRKAVDCIVYGISDRSIRNGAQAQNSSEPEDLLNFLASQRHQQLLTSKSREHTTQKSSSGNPGANSNGANSSITCYNCRSKGHPYFRCTKPILKCKRCNRIGHDNDGCKLEPFVSANSKSNQAGNTAEKNTLKIDCYNESNAKFFKSVLINDRTFKAYVDFGSECTLLRKTDAEVLNLVKNFDNVPVVKGFGQSSVIPLYKTTVSARIDEIESDIEALVVDDVYMQTSLIIGQNFTELPFITVLKDSSTLTFYKSPSLALSEDPKGILKLYITNRIQVSKTSFVPVHSGCDFTGDVFIKGYSAVEIGKEFHLLQGAFSISNGKGVVIVTNLSPSPVTLEPNVLIARSIPFNEQKVSQISRIVKDSSTMEPLNKDDIQTGPGLDSDQIDRLYLLLQNYRDCFATKLNEIGCTVDVEMKIDLADNKPIIYRPYRLSHHEREQVRETIDELLLNDIIQESKSDYASPILMVKKKTGEQRLCVDFRALNNKTIKDRFPLPLIEDQISNLSGNCFFTTLDLASGYYQIPMAKESQHLTGFVTPDGHFEFKRMPFGLANAPAVFQRMINKILGNRRFEYALAYLDDVLIPSKSIDEMFTRLEDVLILFRQYGLTLKLTKCRFFDNTVSYLGYEISPHGIQPSEAKILAVKEFPKPQNVHEVRQFLGLTGYFRKFIKGYGEVARPLTSLLKKDSVWKWSNTEDQAFLILIERLANRPVLALYDPTLETELHTDASSLGVGGILMQWQKDVRILKPVAYFSRQTTPEEKHLHSYELETLAVVCSLKKFRVYLLGVNFKVYTDCAALRTTLTKRDLVPRIARWWLQISEFTFDIEYRPGVQMSHVDALSRNTRLCAEPDNSPSVGVYSIGKENWLLSLQLADPEISRIVKIL
ncbi:jg26524, partial [Pararge aegeria aegeria]